MTHARSVIKSTFKTKWDLESLCKRLAVGKSAQSCTSCAVGEKLLDMLNHLFIALVELTKNNMQRELPRVRIETAFQEKLRPQSLNWIFKSDFGDPQSECAEDLSFSGSSQHGTTPATR